MTQASSYLWTFWDRYTDQDVIPEWGNPGRADKLREFTRSEPILAGALASMTSKAVSLDWQITGGRNRVTRYQEILAEADNGAGWSFFLDRWLQDYWQVDQGGFVELGRQGKRGPVVSIFNLDGGVCQLLATPQTPVAYYPRLIGGTIGGRRILFEPEDFTRIVDLPSPDESKGGLGFCATSRALKVAKVLMALYSYEEERLADMPLPGIAAITGMTQSEVKAAFDLYKAHRDSKEQTTFKGLLWLAAQSSPINPISVNLTSFASLPEGFDKRTTVDLYVYTLALDFGVDVREFWPASQTGATKAEAEVQAQKAKGKGFGRALSSVERAINWDVLPEGLEFLFDQKDSEDDLLRETIREKVIANIVALAGGQLLTPDEARRWLVELEMAPEWLAETGITTAHGLSNTTEDAPEVVEQPDLQQPPAEGKTPPAADQAVAEKAARARLGPGEDFVAINSAGQVVTLWSSRRMFAVGAKRYNPDQPRAPKGTETGGQWVDETGASTERYDITVTHHPEPLDLSGSADDIKQRLVAAIPTRVTKIYDMQLYKTGENRDRLWGFFSPDGDAIAAAGNVSGMHSDWIGDANPETTGKRGKIERALRRKGFVRFAYTGKELNLEWTGDLSGSIRSEMRDFLSAHPQVDVVWDAHYDWGTDGGYRDSFEKLVGWSEKRYNPDQPRAPKGSETGGQWVAGAGGGSGIPSQTEPGGRAPAGGMIGMNGLYYPGGSFLPSTTLGKLPPASNASRSGSGKRLVARGEWAERPTPTAESIWHMIVGTYAGENRQSGELEPTRDYLRYAYEDENANPPIMFRGQWFGRLNDLISAWNTGARWVEPTDKENIVEKRYDPDQPRAPKGSETGGQWVQTATGAGGVPLFFGEVVNPVDFDGNEDNATIAVRLASVVPTRVTDIYDLETGPAGKTWGWFTPDGKAISLQPEALSVTHLDMVGQDVEVYDELLRRGFVRFSYMDFGDYKELALEYRGEFSGPLRAELRDFLLAHPDLSVIHENADNWVTGFSPAAGTRLQLERLLGVEKRYNPDQPRVPAGRREGGQWSDDAGGTVMPRNARLYMRSNRPFIGPNGSKLVAYEHKTVEDLAYNEREGYYSKQVSDWDNAGRCATCGRKIVHVYFVEDPDGKIATYGSEHLWQALGYRDDSWMNTGQINKLRAQLIADQNAWQLNMEEAHAKVTERAAGDIQQANLNYHQMGGRGTPADQTSLMERDDGMLVRVFGPYQVTAAAQQGYRPRVIGSNAREDDRQRFVDLFGQDEIERIYAEQRRRAAELAEMTKAQAADPLVAALAAATQALLEAEKRFDPDQPRWPEGDPRGGQWRPAGGEPSSSEPAPKPPAEPQPQPRRGRQRFFWNATAWDAGALSTEQLQAKLDEEPNNLSRMGITAAELQEIVALDGYNTTVQITEYGGSATRLSIAFYEIGSGYEVGEQSLVFDWDPDWDPSEEQEEEEDFDWASQYPPPSDPVTGAPMWEKETGEEDEEAPDLWPGNEHIQVDCGLLKFESRYQNAGLSEQLVNKQFAFAVEKGFSKVKALADITIGRYAWAKQGFEYAEEWAADKATQKFRSWCEDLDIDLDGHGGWPDFYSPKDVAEFAVPGIKVPYYKLENRDIRADDYELGKAFMLDDNGHGDWHAVKDLSEYNWMYRDNGPARAATPEETHGQLSFNLEHPSFYRYRLLTRRNVRDFWQSEPIRIDL